MTSGRFISTPTGRETEQVGLEGLKVLVVDDSKTILRSAELYLKEKGCEVRTVEDGFQSLSMIDDYQPDIIFLDIMMPRLDGYQTCAMIKSNEEYADIPVIMLSSKHNLFDKARGRLSGSEEYLTKPFSHDDLIGAINKYTKQDESEDLPEEFIL